MVEIPEGFVIFLRGDEEIMKTKAPVFSTKIVARYFIRKVP